MRPTYKSLNQATYLYTKGKEFMLDFEEYIGEYHIADNEPYTEPVHSPKSKILRPYNEDPSILIYSTIKPSNKNLKNLIEPYDCKVVPKKANYDMGFFVRYFIRRRNDVTNFIYEVTEEVSKLYGAVNGIDSNLYQLVEMNWYLTRNPKNKSKIELNNIKEMKKANRKMPGIVDHITSYYEFSEEII